MELNYKITVIKKDEVIIAKFAKRKTAKDSIKKLKKWFPDTFVSGALEEKREKDAIIRWVVTWVCNKNIRYGKKRTIFYCLRNRTR